MQYKDRDAIDILHAIDLPVTYAQIRERQTPPKKEREEPKGKKGEKVDREKLKDNPYEDALDEIYDLLHADEEQAEQYVQKGGQ